MKSSIILWKTNKSVAFLKKMEEIAFHLETIKEIGIDKRFIVLLRNNATDFCVDIRLRGKYANALHVIRYKSVLFSGFHYYNGLVAAGSDDGKIW